MNHHGSDNAARQQLHFSPGAQPGTCSCYVLQPGCDQDGSPCLPKDVIYLIDFVNVLLCTVGLARQKNLSYFLTVRSKIHGFGSG
jgi:hypothetical protein